LHSSTRNESKIVYEIRRAEFNLGAKLKEVGSRVIGVLMLVVSTKNLDSLPRPETLNVETDSIVTNIVLECSTINADFS